MTVDRWLAVAFGVVSAIALLAAWRWRPRKTKLLVTWEATRLVPQVPAAAMFEVTFKDVRVRDPHIVSVTVSNAGPKDISADQFDRGAPLEIHHGAVLLGVVARDGEAPLIIPALGSSDPLLLGPALLKVGETWAVDAIVDGRPSVDLHGRLANVVLDERTRSDLLELAASATSGGLNGLVAWIGESMEAMVSLLLDGPRRRR